MFSISMMMSTGIAGLSGDIGIIANHGNSNVVEYITISVLSNAVDFGDMTLTRWNNHGACSNGSNNRGIFGGGNAAGTNSNVIDYVTINKPSNAVDFGDLNIARYYVIASSNGINNRGLFAGGRYAGPTTTGLIEYVTISTLGNASGFGNMTSVRYGHGACSNSINNRGIFGGGYNNSNVYLSSIDYVTITSPSGASSFGQMTSARGYTNATSNGENNRGVFIGGAITGGLEQNTIDYITITSIGNAVDFGDLLGISVYHAATSSGVRNRGIVAGGNPPNWSIYYFTISSLGNAISFGSLTVSGYNSAACSNA